MIWGVKFDFCAIFVFLFIVVFFEPANSPLPPPQLFFFFVSLRWRGSSRATVYLTELLSLWPYTFSPSASCNNFVDFWRKHNGCCCWLAFLKLLVGLLSLRWPGFYTLSHWPRTSMQIRTSNFIETILIYILFVGHWVKVLKPAGPCNTQAASIFRRSTMVAPIYLSCKLCFKVYIKPKPVLVFNRVGKIRAPVRCFSIYCYLTLFKTREKSLPGHTLWLFCYFITHTWLVAYYWWLREWFGLVILFT